MAPLPQNSTKRVYLDYTSASLEHTMILRMPAAETDPLDYANTYAAIFATRMHPTNAFIRARYSAAGSDFSLPLAFSVVSGTASGSTPSWDEDPESAQLSFVMRGTTTGRRARVEFFTPLKTTSWPADNRYQSGDSSVIDTLRINFAAAASLGGSNPLASIGGDTVTVYGYTNICKNSYWQRKQRGG